MTSTQDNVRMSLGEHLEELRRCLIRALLGIAVGAGVCLLFFSRLMQVILWPLGAATAGNPPRLVYTSLAEPFTTYIRVSLIAGFILSSPYWLRQLWRFVAAGLYEHERRIVRRCVLPSVGLFLIGAAFYFVVISPYVVRWFLLFGQEVFPSPPAWGPDWYHRAVSGTAPASQPAAGPYLQPMLSLNEYISFTVLSSAAFGLAFQTPLVVYVLARTGLVQLDTLRRFRRYVVVIILVAAAAITPTGDAVTMLALAGPMYLLYELGLLAARRRRKPSEPAG